MTTLELERVARDIVPPVGATAWRITERGSAADGSTIYAVVPIIGGRLDGAVVYRGAQDDVRRMHDILVGRRASTSRKPTQAAVAVSESAPEGPQPLTSAGRTGVGSIPRADASGERTPGGASIPRLCAGCDEPLPEDAGAQRLTHDGACRIAAFRRRAATNSTPADADSGTRLVTPSRPSTGPTPRPAAAEPAPTEDGLHRQPDQQLTEAPARNPGASTPTASVPDRATSVRGVEAQLRDPSGAP